MTADTKRSWKDKMGAFAHSAAVKTRGFFDLPLFRFLKQPKPCVVFFIACAVVLLGAVLANVLTGSLVFGIIGFAALCIAFIHPSHRFRFFFFGLTFSFSAVMHFGLSFSFFTIATLLFNVASLFYILLEQGKGFFKQRQILPLILVLFTFFCLVSSVSLLRTFSGKFFFSLGQHLLYFGAFIFFALYYRFGLIRRHDFIALAYGIALSSLFALPAVFSESYRLLLFKAMNSVDTIVYKEVGFLPGLGKIFAFTGTQNEPNYFGMTVILACTTLIAVGFEKRKLPWLDAVLFFFFAIVGLLSLSSTFLLSMALLCVAVTIDAIAPKKRLSRLLVLGVFLTAAGIAFFVPSIQSLLPDSNLSFREYLISLTRFRTELFYEGVSWTFSDPLMFLFGAGWDQATLPYDAISAHNFLFHGLNTVGLIGLSLWVYATFLACQILFDGHQRPAFSFQTTLLAVPLFFSLLSLPAFASWFSLFSILSVASLFTGKEESHAD